MMEMTGAAAAGGGAREREGEDGLGLGLLVQQKLARTETFPFRVPSNVGPTLCNGSDLYDVGGIAAPAIAAAAGEARTLQPFAFKSPGVGGMTAASLLCPFTWAQWQELERQALIYKYMVASVPVPPELIIPTNYRGSSTFSDAVAAAAAAHQSMVVRGGGGGSCFNHRFSSNSSDSEPGRCRRTDGKKWRCSRDVAPDQKYCERHMHRGRPRSRKPVEVQTQNATRPLAAATAAPATAATNTAPLSAHLTTTRTTTTASASYQTPGLFGKPEMNHPFQAMVTATAAEKESRYLDQMESDQQWQLMHSKVGFRPDSSVCSKGPVMQPFDDHLNLNFTDFGGGGSEAQQSDQCCLYLNSDLSSLEEPGPDQRQPPRCFIDAWSITARDRPTNNDCGKSPVSSGGKLPISSLTLSMSGGSGTAADDMDQIQMGLSISESERENCSGKSLPLSCMNSVPWLSPPSLGGPLGEVLQSGTVAGSNLASPHGGSSSKSSCGGLNLMSDAWGEAASSYDRAPRPDSSPTGVLQKTLASLSDSSSSSSPTFAASKPEIALQWLSQSKLSSS